MGRDGWLCFRTAKRNETGEGLVLELERKVDNLVRLPEDVVTTQS